MTDHKTPTENVEGLAAELRRHRSEQFGLPLDLLNCLERAADRIASLEAQLAEREKDIIEERTATLDLAISLDAARAENARLSGQLAKARESLGAIEIGLSDGMHFTLLRMVREALADLPATSVEPEYDFQIEDAMRDKYGEWGTDGRTDFADDFSAKEPTEPERSQGSPMTQDRAAEIADLFFDPNGPNEAECHEAMVLEIKAALSAAREEGKREGLVVAADVIALWSPHSNLAELVDLVRALAAKEKP